MASETEPKFTVIVAIDGSEQAEHAFNCKFLKSFDLHFCFMKIRNIFLILILLPQFT